MWPFKKKEVVESKPTIDPQATEYARMLEIIAWRDIGDEFNYLGVKCLLTHYSQVKTRYLFVDLFPTPYPFMLAVIEADYVDNNGQLRVICFDYSELGNLIKQNEPTI